MVSSCSFKTVQECPQSCPLTWQVPTLKVNGEQQFGVATTFERRNRRGKFRCCWLPVGFLHVVTRYTGCARLDTYLSMMDLKTKSTTKNKPTNESFYHRQLQGQRPERERCQCSILISSPTCLSGKKIWVVISLCGSEILKYSISICAAGSWETKDLCLWFWEVHAVASWERLDYFFWGGVLWWKVLVRVGPQGIGKEVQIAGLGEKEKESITSWAQTVLSLFWLCWTSLQSSHLPSQASFIRCYSQGWPHSL